MEQSRPSWNALGSIVFRLPKLCCFIATPHALPSKSDDRCPRIWRSHHLFLPASNPRFYNINIFQPRANGRGRVSFRGESEGANARLNGYDGRNSMNALQEALGKVL